MTAWPNPFIMQNSDPFILRTEQHYYFTASIPEYNRLEIRRADTLMGLREAKPVTVWRKPDRGPYSQLIWAPELHRFGEQWVIYFAAAPACGYINGLFQHRMYALVCDDDDPLTGYWQACRRIFTPYDTFSLDGSHFVHQGKHWYLWAQKDPFVAANTCIYLAELEKNPWTLKGQTVMISQPELAWENAEVGVNEAPAALLYGDRLFVSYSAGATDENYCMGLLWIDKDADLLQRSNWQKSPCPVFSTSVENKQFGPGHNGFTLDEHGRHVMVYHTRNHTGRRGDGVWDPSRHTRLKYFHWRDDGMPDFGIPPAQNLYSGP